MAVGGTSHNVLYSLFSKSLVAAHWNGTAWSLEAMPRPAAAKSVAIYGVSCAAPNACTAVGGYPTGKSSRATVVERWDGSSWRLQSSPTQGNGGLGDSLFVVSCPSTSRCTAMGVTGSAEHWNGQSWELEPIAQPPGTKAGDHQVLWLGVSCPTTSTCSATGLYQAGGSRNTIAEQWRAFGNGEQTPPATTTGVPTTTT